MPDERLPVMPVIVMIVGTPFSYKTSLAMTAADPIHLDGDRGAQRAVGRCPVFVIDSWQEVKDADAAGVFADKKTLILDTPKSLIEDYIWNYTQSIKYQSNTMKIYGEIGTEFKSFVANARAKKMDLVMVSHEKTKEQGDKTIYEPDITGQSKQLLLRMCDQVGFMEKRERKDAKTGKQIIDTILTFNPTPQWPFCKNVAGLPDMVLPHYTAPEWKNFLDREVIVPTKDAMAKMTDEQKDALEFISQWQTAIDALVPEEASTETAGKELLETMTEISKIKEDHLKKQIRAYFVAHLKKIAWQWVEAEKAFKPKDVPKTAEANKSEAAPAVQQPVQEQAQYLTEQQKADKPKVAQSESNPGGLLPPATTPKIEKLPDTAKTPIVVLSHAEAAKIDLFAPRGDHAQDAFDQTQAEMNSDLFAPETE